jgi:hypothetical protein
MDAETPVDGSQWIADYVAVRDMKAKLEEAHKERVAQYNELLAKLEVKILQFLQEHNIDTVSSKAGTAYVRTVKSASIADGELFKGFVLNNEAFELVDWKANANAVSDYITENGAAPPGVNFSTMQKIGVRRK